MRSILINYYCPIYFAIYLTCKMNGLGIFWKSGLGQRCGAWGFNWWAHWSLTYCIPLSQNCFILINQSSHHGSFPTNSDI